MLRSRKHRDPLLSQRVSERSSPCIRHRPTDTTKVYPQVHRGTRANRPSPYRSGRYSSHAGFSTPASWSPTPYSPAAWSPTVPSSCGLGWRATPGLRASASRCCPCWRRTLVSQSARSNATWLSSFLAASSAPASAGSASRTCASSSGTRPWRPLVWLTPGRNIWNNKHTTLHKKVLFCVKMCKSLSSCSKAPSQRQLQPQTRRTGRQPQRPAARQSCRPV